MSDTVLIVLIVAVLILLILFMFRRVLSRFFLRASREGLEAELVTQEAVFPEQESHAATRSQNKVEVRGNKQIGSDNAINVGRDSSTVSDNIQAGTGQTIDVSRKMSEDEEI